jgi:hypothetical protein
MNVKAERQLKKLKRARRKAELMCDEVLLALKITKGEVKIACPPPLAFLDERADVATFKFLWRNYALADDAKLTEAARRLKQELLGVVEEHPAGLDPPTCEMVALDRREKDTLIAALRLWQKELVISYELAEIADNGREGPDARLLPAEIDSLIEGRLGV